MKEIRMFFNALNKLENKPRFNHNKTKIMVNISDTITTIYFFDRQGKFLRSNCYANEIMPQHIKDDMHIE